MPPRDRGVDSISSGLDKHDFTRGKVDGGNLPTGERNTRSAVSMREGAGERGPLGSAEAVPVDDLGDGGRARRIEVACGVCKITKMLDNSGRKVDEQGQELAANASADETRVAVRGIVRVRDSMASNVGQDVVSLRANERADQMRRSRRQHSEPDRAR